MNILNVQPADMIFSHPLRWAASHLLSYAVTAAVVAAGFFAFAAGYAYFVPVDAPAKQQMLPASPVSFPKEKPPQEFVPAKPNDEVLVSGLGSVKAIDIATAMVVEDSSQHVAAFVKGVYADKNGRAAVALFDGKTGKATGLVWADQLSWTKTGDGIVVAKLPGNLATQLFIQSSSSPKASPETTGIAAPNPTTPPVDGTSPQQR